jgi:hypothetical protein
LLNIFTVKGTLLLTNSSLLAGINKTEGFANRDQVFWFVPLFKYMNISSNPEGQKIKLVFDGINPKLIAWYRASL